MITKGQAMALRVGTILYHSVLRNSDGSALRARVMGKCKEWKKEPLRFRLPVCHGLRDYGNIDQSNNGVWSTVEPK